MLSSTMRRENVKPKIHRNPSSEIPRFQSTAIGALDRHRDSDASLCSSRPSIASIGGVNNAGSNRPSSSSAVFTDRAAALRAVNEYLSNLPNTVFLKSTSKSPIPPERDIEKAFVLILAEFGWVISGKSLKEELNLLLQALGCPIKLNQSALKSPATPHAWPQILWVLHWLTQLSRLADHLSSSGPAEPSSEFPAFLAKSYNLFYICGDDAASEELDAEYFQKAQHQADNATTAVAELEQEAKDLEKRKGLMTSEPSRREALEKERAVLAEDARKFEAVINNFKPKKFEMEHKIGEWEHELDVKLGEARRIAQENEDLVKKVEGQVVSVREVEKMRREMQTIDMDIMEAEKEIIALDEKASELDAESRSMFKDIEVLAEDCNQAIRKLKLGKDFHYMPSARGSTTAEVMGIDYKNTLKRALNDLSEETKKLSFTKLEESIALQKHSSEKAKRIEEKRDSVAALQQKVENSEALLHRLKKEIDDCASRCTTEMEIMKEDLARKELELSLVEKDVEEFLKISEQILEEATREVEERTQICAHELLATIDAVSDYKEFMESTISGMRADLSETAVIVAEIFKSQRLIKRARPSPIY